MDENKLSESETLQENANTANTDDTLDKTEQTSTQSEQTAEENPSSNAVKLSLEKKPPHPRKNGKRRKKKKFTIPLRFALVCIALVALAIGGLFYIFNYDKISDIGKENAVFSAEYNISARNDFSPVGRSVYYCSKDGMQLLNKSGSTVWTDTYSMTAPVMLCDGNYAAVADDKGRQLIVYNTGGRLYAVSTSGAITSFAINAKGNSAVIYQNNAESDYNVDIYSPAGEILSQGRYVIEDGIPTCVDVSNDGKYFSVGFIDIKNLKAQSSISFYYTDKNSAKSANNSDGMFSAINLGTDIIATLRFMPDNSCMAFTDKYMANIGGGNTKTYVQNWKQEYTNKPVAMSIISEQYIALGFGESLEFSSNDGSELANTVHFYNYRNGKEVGSASVQAEITSLNGAFDSCIIGCGNSFTAVDIRGKKLWSYSALQQINKLMFYTRSNKVLMATANKLSLYNIKNGSVLVEKDTDIEEEGNTEATTEAATEAVTEAAS